MYLLVLASLVGIRLCLRVTKEAEAATDSLTKMDRLKCKECVRVPVCSVLKSYSTGFSSFKSFPEITLVCLFSNVSFFGCIARKENVNLEIFVVTSKILEREEEETR